jgi:tetratricopeptide (TPR) repeat protein
MQPKRMGDLVSMNRGLLSLGPALCWLSVVCTTPTAAQTKLPSTDHFMNALGTCAAGMKMKLSADIAGSVKSFYEGARTKGSAELENAPDFLILFPEAQRADAYKLYVDCVKGLVPAFRVPEEGPKLEKCAAVYAECGRDYRGTGSAMRSCQRYVDCDPNNPGAHQLLAEALLLNRGQTAAEVEFQKVVSLGTDKNDQSAIASGYDGLARVYMARESYSEAERFARKSIEINMKADNPRKLAQSYKTLGLIYKNSGAWRSARAEFDKAASLFQRVDQKFGLGQIYWSLGDMMAERGDLRSSCSYFRQARALHVAANYPRGVEIADRRLKRHRCH